MRITSFLPSSQKTAVKIDYRKRLERNTEIALIIVGPGRGVWPSRAHNRQTSPAAATVSLPAGEEFIYFVLCKFCFHYGVYSFPYFTAALSECNCYTGRSLYVVRINFIIVKITNIFDTTAIMGYIRSAAGRPNGCSKNTSPGKCGSQSPWQKGADNKCQRWNGKGEEIVYVWAWGRVWYLGWQGLKLQGNGLNQIFRRSVSFRLPCRVGYRMYFWEKGGVILWEF